MPGSLAKQDLAAELQKAAGNLGLTVTSDAGRVGGHVGKIRAKWWLGGRLVTYDMACLISEADHTVHFREDVGERSWGIPPPTLTVEMTTQAGWEVSGQRHDLSVGGGGMLDYAQARQSIERTVTAAGWQFQLDAGRRP